MTHKPRNRHILIAECKDPANLERPDGIKVALFPLKQMVFGVVVAIDETPGPEHVCKVGDVVYFLEPNIGGSVRADGGEILRLVRECFIINVVDDVPAERLTGVVTQEDFERMKSHARQPALAIPKNRVEIIQ